MLAAGLQAENVTQAAPAAVSVVRADPRTGKLVRTIVVSGKPARNNPAADPAVRSLIEETARTFDVNPLLVDSVIQVESNYNPFALSNKGAQGLMQLMPATAQRFGVTNAFNVRENIEGGVRYLKFLQDAFQDDNLAIAAYNAGEKAVTKYGTVPPYTETVNYVAKVSKKYGQAKQAAQKNKAEIQARAKETPADGEPRHVDGFVDAEGRLHLTTR